MTVTNNDRSLPTGPDLLSAALSFAANGVLILPCHPVNKNPLTEHGYKDASIDPSQIREWWAKEPRSIIGSPTGKITNRVVIDIDSERAEEELNLLAEQANSPLPPTYTVKTHDGKHLYFNYPASDKKIGCSNRKFPGQIDVRGDGGLVIIPPSPHPAGGFYSVIDPRPKADLPPWLLALLVGLAENETVYIKEVSPRWAWQHYHRVLTRLRQAKKGERNTLLNNAAWWASRLSDHPQLAEDRTCQEILETAKRVGLDEREARSTYASGWRAGRDCKLTILPIHECTDLGNADRFVLRYGDRVRYVPAYGDKTGWHVWDGHRWNPDGKRLVQKLAHETVRAIYQEAAAVEDHDIRKRLVSHAIKSENSKSITALLKEAQPYVAVEPHELDADPELLNLENGTLDLRTGEVREQRQSDLITRMIPVCYQPSAPCPLFEKHLTMVLPDPRVRDYYLETIAYAYSGSTAEQCIHVTYGNGDNGKTTTDDLFRNMAGDYGWVVKREFFADGYDSVPSHDIAELYGRRLVTCSEFEEGDVLRIALMKTLTGGQTTEVQGCRKYGHPFKFRPQVKFLLDSNYLLKVDSPDLGTWRRIRIIPFNENISKSTTKDLHFSSKLWAERSGVLNLIIAGLKRWNARGRVLEIPDAIKKASGVYEQESDLLSRFIEEKCIKSQQRRTLLRAFAATYKDWLKGVTKKSKAQIGEREMERRLCEKQFSVEYDERLRAKVIIGYELRGFEHGF
jgi:putative DNA primase/helicase